MAQTQGGGPIGVWPAGLAEPERLLEALSNALFRDNPDLVWDFGPDGRVRRVNARVTSLLGYAPGAVIGRHLRELVVSEDWPDVEAGFRRALDGRPALGTWRLRHADGRTVAASATFVPLRTADGRVSVVYAGLRDVSAAAAAQQALAEREALYSLIVEQSPECVCIYQDERYAYVNPAGARMAADTALSPAEIVGHGWMDFTHPDDRAAAVSLFREVTAAAPGTSAPYERRLVWPNGRVVEVEGRLTAVTYRGRPALHAFSRDVTARRLAEGERLRAQRFEALGRLAAGVAHDFNNLLAVMLAAIEQAAEAVPGDAALRADLAEAAGAARRGRALTRQLLTFARREPAAARPLDVNEVVRGMQELLRRIAGPRVRLALALAPDAGVVVADPAQAEQVLLNLVANARDAMPGGGEIRVETARENGDLRLTVRDTGPGIPPDVRPHLFEPFFTTKAEGHGLGLATVYGVVTQAGGRVDVESEPGRGAAFHLRLPRAD